MITAVLLCGGLGQRMQSLIPKQYLPLGGMTIAERSYSALRASPSIDTIIVVCDEKRRPLFPGALFTLPGSTRQDSLAGALSALPKDTSHILVHDGARPLIQPADIEQVITIGIETGAATLAVPVTSTIKQADSSLTVKKTLARETLYTIQTPQVLERRLIEEGMAKVRKDNVTVTDDTSLAELINAPVKLVIGNPSNIKITTPEDLACAAAMLETHEVSP